MKKLSSVFFALVLMISLFQSTGVFAMNKDVEAAEEAEPKVADQTNTIYNKLHFYLDIDDFTTIDSYEELERAINYTVKEFAVKKNEQASSRGETFNSYQVTVEFASDIKNTETYKELLQERENISTMSEVRSFRRRLNSFSKEYHANLVEDNLYSLSKLQYSHAEHIAYSPVVVLTAPINNITIDALLTLAKQNNTINISISIEEEAKDDLPPIETPFDDGYTTVDPNTWEDALKTINAYDIVAEGIYTGESVRIGILEAGGVCDIYNAGLIDKDITLESNNLAISNHATAVTLIVSQIAPDAELYVSITSRSRYLAWFIDNDCDVINCSFGMYYGIGEEDNYQYRYDYDGVYDYQIDIHMITVVKSAGNKRTDTGAYNPNCKIASPGYAFNVITVGGITKNTSNNLVWHSGASHDSSWFPDNKPNISAKYKIIDVPHYVNDDGNSTFTGTSAATPQVTGCVALLIGRYAGLCCKPAAVHSLIASTASKTFDYSAGSSSGFDDKVGAGVINLGKMMSNPNYTELYNVTGEDGDYLYSRSIYLSAGQQIQIAIAWIVEVDYPNDEVYVTDYDLLLLFESGPIIEAQSMCMDSNIEMLRSTITVSGIYTIVVAQFSDMDPNIEDDHVVLTYNYH